MTPPILVWPYSTAPKQYQGLSENGGDEDWIAFIPDYMASEPIPWTEQGSYFGCCDVSEYKVKGGVIRIGSHA